MTWWQWLLSLFRPTPAPTPKPAPQPIPVPTGLGAALLEASNAARAHAGLPPFRLDSRLQAAAAQHARDMAASGVMSHAGFPARVMRAGYTYSATAENVDMERATAQAAVNYWLSDPPHRANLLGEFNDMGGSGARASDGTWYWCADYGSQG